MLSSSGTPGVGKGSREPGFQTEGKAFAALLKHREEVRCGWFVKGEIGGEQEPDFERILNSVLFLH